MIELPTNMYNIAKGLLNEVPFNSLFAKTIIRKKHKGQIFVNNLNNPSVFYIVHPYGMSLLIGSSGNDNFINEFSDYILTNTLKKEEDEWMQVFPRSWDTILKKMCDNKISYTPENNTFVPVCVHTRLNFSFNEEKFHNLKKQNHEVEICKTNSEFFNSMKGTVLPKYFWNNETDFLENGIGFSAVSNKQLASTAFSAFIIDGKLEIGIQTIPEFQGKGFAKAACLALIDYCIEKKLEPVWSCRKDNIASVALAKSIGFEQSLELPYYRLHFSSNCHKSQ